VSAAATKKPSLVIHPPAQKKKRREPALVRGVLGATLEQYGLDKKIARYQFVLRWPEVVGPEIAKRARPEALRGSCLMVHVDSSAWVQELSFQKAVILARLKKILDDPDLIKDISFRVG
jgi:predicted nucleic acid-binding Zn ribbon protein